MYIPIDKLNLRESAHSFLHAICRFSFSQVHIVSTSKARWLIKWIIDYLIGLPSARLIGPSSPSLQVQAETSRRCPSDPTLLRKISQTTNKAINIEQCPPISMLPRLQRRRSPQRTLRLKQSHGAPGPPSPANHAGGRSSNATDPFLASSAREPDDTTIVPTTIARTSPATRITRIANRGARCRVWTRLPRVLFELWRQQHPARSARMGCKRLRTSRLASRGWRERSSSRRDRLARADLFMIPCLCGIRICAPRQGLSWSKPRDRGIMGQVMK